MNILVPGATFKFWFTAAAKSPIPWSFRCSRWLIQWSQLMSCAALKVPAIEYFERTGSYTYTGINITATTYILGCKTHCYGDTDSECAAGGGQARVPWRDSRRSARAICLQIRGAAVRRYKDVRLTGPSSVVRGECTQQHVRCVTIVTRVRVIVTIV